jgi:hypothetical protein
MGDKFVNITNEVKMALQQLQRGIERTDGQEVPERRAILQWRGEMTVEKTEKTAMGRCCTFL